MSLIAVVVGMAVHLGVPSLLLWRIFAPGGRLLDFLPTAVAGAVGWNLLVAQVLERLSAGPDHRTALVADLLLGVVALRTRPPRQDASSHVWRDPSAATITLAAAVLAGVAIWTVVLVSSGSTPPFQDSVHHGYMTRKIVELHTVDPETVASLDAAGDVISARYYPLGLHTTAAFAHQTSGARIDHLLVAWTVVASALLFPLGAFAFTRALVDDELAGACSAVGAIAIAELPYLAYGWGGVPTIVGTALAPGLGAGLAEAVRQRAWRLIVLSALGFAGLFSITNNAVFLPAALALCIAFRSPALLGAHEVRRRAIRVGAAAIVSVALLAPTFAAVLRGASERAELPHLVSGTTSDVLVGLVTGRLELGSVQLATSALAALGIAILVRRRRWGLVLIALTVTFLAMVASADDGLLAKLTVPWYGSAYRIGYLFTVVKVVALGVGAGVLLHRWSGPPARSRAVWRALAAGVVVLAVATVPGVGRATAAHVSGAIDDGVVIDDASRRAFELLREQNGTAATVAGEYCDESTWMYAYEGVPPLFGVLTPNPKGIPEMAPRLTLLRHLDAGEDPRALPLVGELGIRFVYFGERSICPPSERLLSLDGLRHNPWLTEVFDQDGAHVFALLHAPE